MISSLAMSTTTALTVVEPRSKPIMYLKCDMENSPEISALADHEALRGAKAMVPRAPLGHCAAAAAACWVPRDGRMPSACMRSVRWIAKWAAVPTTFGVLRENLYIGRLSSGFAST
jgi:hypothetical protein